MRKFFAVSAAFLTGLAAGALVSRRPAATLPEDPSPVTILHVSDPAAQPVRLVVHRRVLDGRGATVREVRPEADLWRIDLADSRVVLFATPEAPPPR